MSLTNVTTPEENVRELEFTIERAAFDKECVAVYKKNVGKMNVPGFRRGKAPKAMIEKLYGTGVFYEEALNNLLPAAYDDAAKASGLEIVSRPEIDIKEMGDENVVVTAKVYVKPDVTIEGYKGIECTRTVAPVTDAEIDADLEKMRERNSRETEITDRPAQMGDVVTLNYDGSVDGVPFDGGKSENYNLKLGSGAFIPGFEDQIVGKSIGEEFDVNVTFPEDYHAENLKGKAAVFACKLNAIKQVELPAIDDEFIKDISEFDTVDAWKADARAKKQESNEKIADNGVEQQILDALIDKLQANIPQAMIDNECENQVRDYDMRLQQNGLNLKDYMKYTGMDLDGMRKQFAPMAERQVKVRLALEKIVALEGLTATEDEIAAEYADLAKYYGMEADEVKKYVDEKSVSSDLCVKKALDLLKSSAVITEKAPEAAEKTEETL